MKGFNAEGIILKRKDLGEADRTLTIFTLQRGKVSVLAKGVRRITSKRAGNVELLNRVSLFLYPGKNFLILTEADSLETYTNLKDDLTLSTYAFHILELVDKLTAENQENPSLYHHLVEVLKRLSKKPRQILIRAFEAKILSDLGFANFTSKNYVSTPEVSAQTGKILGVLGSLDWEEIERLEVNANQALELERVLRYHVERVIEGQLKSRQFLKKI